MSWSARVRRAHRWLSIAFTIGVIVNLVALRRGPPSAGIGFLALFPLVLLELTGLFLLAQHHVAKRRGRPTARLSGAPPADLPPRAPP